MKVVENLFKKSVWGGGGNFWKDMLYVHNGMHDRYISTVNFMNYLFANIAIVQL